MASEARLAALELQGNLVRSYIGLALHHAELDIAEAELARQEQLLALVRQRRRDGIGTGLEETRAGMGLPEAHRQIDLLHEAIELDRNQVAALAGVGPGRARRCNARPCRRCWTWACRRACPWSCSATGRTWPARWRVAAEARGIEAAKADFYPNVDLLGGLGSSAVQGGVLDFLRYDKLTWGLGPALSLPIYDGGLRRGRLAEAGPATTWRCRATTRRWCRRSRAWPMPWCG